MADKTPDPTALSASEQRNAAPVPRQGFFVGIGASAGALEALERFFAHVPADSGLCFVVVQHLERHHPSVLSELLGKYTRMPVEQAEDATRARPNHVYVIPPNSVLTLEKGVLRVVKAAEAGLRTPVDSFLRSLAQDRGKAAAGIILSGTGTDGTTGLRAIKEHGGLTLAQAPETAKYESMPESAISAGLVDAALPVEEMPARLLVYARHLAVIQRDKAARADDEIAANLKKICETLLRHTGHDFSRYKEGTLVRRIGRRMRIQESASVGEYVQRLEREASEAESLVRDLSIGVTHFFRDAEVFEALERLCLPAILDGGNPSTPARIWVPGCASGEEAYSIAILVREHLARQQSTRSVQIFATDIDSDLVATARHGTYSDEICEHVSPERLARFFVKEQGSKEVSFQVIKELRDMCTFSVHSLIRDPPFSSLDLVSCRNVLIYLGAELQKKLVPLFHFALRSGGYLLLGPSEDLAARDELFARVDRQHRLFRRNDAVVRPPELPLTGRLASRGTPRPLPQAPESLVQPPVLSQALERMIREEYAPPCIVVNERGEVLYLAGRTSLYLQAREGAPTNNLLDQAHTSLRIELRLALATAVKTRRAVVRPNVPIEPEKAGGSVRHLCLTVRPLPGLPVEAGLYAVVLEESEAAAGLEAVGEVESAPTLERERLIIEQLEDELRTTRADLQSSAEELETSNEELKSANEELISTNEELQSANEELQSSREELQTINDELREKVQALDVAQSDLQSHYASSQIATLFLDRDLRITRFTPAATTLFNLIASDVGRPIGDLAPRVHYEQLLADAQTVLRTEKGVEQRVRASDGDTWFLMRVLPYRTQRGEVAGVGMTFVDVTSLARAEEALRQANLQLAEADRRKNEFLAVLSHELRNPLTPIRNSTYILERAAPGGDQARRALAVIDRQAGQLAYLVDELLDVTRITQNKMELQRQTLELNELARDTLEDHRSLFEKAEVHLELQPAPRPVFVNADWNRLAQVLGNLLQNAAKFTGRGGAARVTISAEATSKRAVIRVADTGVGMALEMVVRLFQPFSQADSTLDRAKSGLGLGLVLVKGLVELHGGEVTAHSAGLGRGAEFVVRLPLAMETAPVPQPRESATQYRRRVLVIEDNRDAADSLREVLELGKHEVEVAYDGPEGIAKAREFRPEVVLCDIGLPGLDGYAVARAFRADEALKGAYLVALSGYALPEDLQRASEAGFEKHLAKPPSLEKLEQVLASMPSRARGPAGSPPETETLH
ncbi:MAG: PAS domain-containing protein [Deltaproteobacteria bacterium]|nr:PAS domain-containing protein [Deltaproteobacteria bacterium]